MTLRRFRQDDAGFSLIELLTAMAIGSLVLAALTTLISRAVATTTQTTDRVEALQRGRVTMDRVTSLLNSQLCLLKSNGDGTPPVIVGDVNQVAFYATLGKVDSVPTIYRLTYNTSTLRLTEDQYAPNTSGVDPTYPGYPATPTRTRVIGTNILPANADSTGLFSYYPFITTEGPTLGMIGPKQTTPLDATAKAATVRVGVGFVTQPEHTPGTTPDPRATRLDGFGAVGSANPGEPSKGVNC
jgi:prepilin-type N-terminal cleavage/methylation domain-containing protein